MYPIEIDTLPLGHDKQAIIDAQHQGSSIDISFCYSSNFQNTRVIRKFVELMSSTLGMGEEWINRLILIVDELNNNAIEHGSRKTMASEMRVKMRKIDGNIVVNIEAEDSGTGMHPKTSQEMEQLRGQALNRGFKNHNSIRGRGLFLIITRLVDDLYFSDAQSGGLIVGINKKVPLT